MARSQGFYPHPVGCRRTSIPVRSVGQPYLLPASECSLVSADRTNIKAKVTATHGLWLGAAAIDSAPVTHAVLRLRHRFSAPSVSALTQNGWCCAFACPPRQHIDRLRSCGPVPDVAHKALATKVVIARLQDAPIERAAEVPSAVQVAVRTDVRLRGAYVRSGRRSGCGGRPPRSGRLNRCSRRRRWLSAAGPSSRPPRRSFVCRRPVSVCGASRP